jgi:ubiquinone biosynthesis protein UbiJ
MNDRVATGAAGGGVRRSRGLASLRPCRALSHGRREGRLAGADHFRLAGDDLFLEDAVILRSQIAGAIGEDVGRLLDRALEDIAAGRAGQLLQRGLQFLEALDLKA